MRSENSAAMNSTRMAATMKKRLKNSGQPVVDEHAVEGGAALQRRRRSGRDQQQSAQRRDGRVAEETLAFGGHPKIRQHQHEAEGDHRRFPG